MFYVHNKVPALFENIAHCSDTRTKIFIWDFHRNVDWSECEEMNRHLKMEFPFLTRQQVLETIQQSQLELTKLEDVTEYVIPGYKLMERECRKRDPELQHLTYPLFGKAIIDGKISYVIYTLKLK